MNNERFINYSIVYIGVIEVSIKDKIYEQNILTKRFINYSIICIGMIEVSIASVQSEFPN